MKQAGNSIANGEIEINPTDGRESSACAYCDFKSVCKIENQLPNIVPNYKNSEVFDKIVKGDNNGI
jgi:ATP-dependent helicase/nuclease subunit B